jgi:uncharacterized membrane protein
VKRFIPFFVILFLLPGVLCRRVEYSGLEKQNPILENGNPDKIDVKHKDLEKQIPLEGTTLKRQTRFSDFLEKKNFSKEAVIVAFATLPIFELRGAIPWAIWHYKMSWHKSYLLAIIGNFLPIPFILLILKYSVELLSRIPIMKKFFDWLFTRTWKKGAVVQKYEELGLILFVMIPLPVTGAWTGSVAAYLFGIKFLPALACIFIGICLAGIIVTILSLLGVWGAVIATIVLIILFIPRIIKIIKKNRVIQERRTKDEEII